MKSDNTGRASRWALLMEESSLVRKYFWKYRRHIGIGVGALLVCDLLEVIPPLLLKDAVDVLGKEDPKPVLMNLALIYLGITLIQGVGRYIWRMFLVRSSMRSGRDLRASYAGKLFGLSSDFYDRRRVGDLMSLATSDVEAVRMALGAGMVVFVDALFYLLTIPVAMFILSPQLTLLSFIPLIFVPFLVVRNEREIHKRFERVQASHSHLASLAQEGLVGARVVKSFGIEETVIGRFAKAGMENVRLNVELARVQTAFGPLLDFSVSLGLVLLLYVGGESVMGLSLSLGTFVAFQRYIQKMVWPMAALGLAITHYQKAVASSWRLKDVLTERESIPLQKRAGRKLEGHIVCDKLTFAHRGAERPALKDVNLVIEPGQRVALVGPVGAGKTTLLSLIAKLYPVEAGRLFIDRTDIHDWTSDDLREQIGYVAQDVFLFSETIFENVAFGLARATEHVEKATRLASIHDEISAFPLGYETRLGERGLNVSGGQKQRLSIARALIREPPLLILDDALSSVDFHTEQEILRSLRTADFKRTQLISAHRISTVKEADMIFVLNRGEIIQQGTHSKLAAQKGLYQQFYQQQQVQEELDAYIRQIET